MAKINGFTKSELCSKCHCKRWRRCCCRHHRFAMAFVIRHRFTVEKKFFNFFFIIFPLRACKMLPFYHCHIFTTNKFLFLVFLMPNRLSVDQSDQPNCPLDDDRAQRYIDEDISVTSEQKSEQEAKTPLIDEKCSMPSAPSVIAHHQQQQIHQTININKNKPPTTETIQNGRHHNANAIIPITTNGYSGGRRGATAATTENGTIITTSRRVAAALAPTASTGVSINTTTDQQQQQQEGDEEEEEANAAVVAPRARRTVPMPLSLLLTPRKKGGGGTSAATTTAHENGKHQKGTTTIAGLSSSSRCCCGIVQIRHVALVLGIVEFVYFASQLIVAFVDLFDSGDEFGYAKAATTSGTFSTLLTIVSLILAIAAAMLLLTGVHLRSPYLLVPHILMQFAFIIASLVIICYLVAWWFGGFKIRISAIVYENSEKGYQGLQTAKDRSPIRANFAVDEFNIIVVLLVICCGLFLMLQLWLCHLVICLFRELLKQPKTVIVASSLSPTHSDTVDSCTTVMMLSTVSSQYSPNTTNNNNNNNNNKGDGNATVVVMNGGGQQQPQQQQQRLQHRPTHSYQHHHFPLSRTASAVQLDHHHYHHHNNNNYHHQQQQHNII